MDWNLLEVTWTLVAAFGAYYSIQNIRESRRDSLLLDKTLHSLSTRSEELKWQIAHIVTHGTDRREIIRAIIHGFFVLLGLASALSDLDQQPVTIVGQVAGFLFIGMSLLLSLSTRGDNVDRKDMLQIGALLVAEEEKEKGV
jgi:hypothetical protein